MPPHTSETVCYEKNETGNITGRVSSLSFSENFLSFPSSLTEKNLDFSSLSSDKSVS